MICQPRVVAPGITRAVAMVREKGGSKPKEALKGRNSRKGVQPLTDRHPENRISENWRELAAEVKVRKANRDVPKGNNIMYF